MTNISEFTADPYNANKGTARGRYMIQESLQQYGAGRSILVDRDGNIIAGNKTHGVAGEIGIDDVIVVESDGTKLVAVKRIDLSINDPAARALALFDNRASEVGLDWDVEMLAELAGEGVPLEEMFSEKELDAMGVDMGGEPVEDPGAEIDRAEELREKWGVKLGDLWQIGSHKLLCGDSTKREDVEWVMGGEKAVVFSDPPYGVSLVKNKMVGADFGVAKKGIYSDVIGDNTTDAARDYYNLCIDLGFTDFILWGGNYFTGFLPNDTGRIVWDKRVDTGIRNTFSDGEIAWTNLTPQVRIYRQLWNGMIREDEHEKRVHPTQKPVRITQEIMRDFPSDIYFDGFGGSGTTMVACQNLNRQCRAVEISLGYCSVILQRMVDTFGITGELIAEKAI